ncbi:MAG: hypothetical protein FWD31_10300 [Planctomycetaceae bacterium]|nr:hypothetical protein [Planctomycetaceae bacterium]
MSHEILGNIERIQSWFGVSEAARQHLFACTEYCVTFGKTVLEEKYKTGESYPKIIRKTRGLSKKNKEYKE